MSLTPTDLSMPAYVSSAGRRWRVVDLREVAARSGVELRRIPYVIRILLENLVRSQMLGRSVEDSEVALVLRAQANVGADLPLFVSRVILPDSSGVPVLQDLAALRDAVARAGGDPALVDTRVPVDLVVDHSLQVDAWGSVDAIKINMRREIERNAERYSFIRWAQQAFRGLRVFPPGSGIIHQVNLERIATVVATASHDGDDWAFPDFVIGGDSHTPMVNGMGVLGWGVGGIDAEAALLGHAYTFPLPEVVGVRLTGAASPLVWTTDVALLVTERLRREKVANCAVEFFGPAAQALSVPERATMANMAPEYGATCGFFAVDRRTLDYLRATGRTEEHIAFVEAYCRKVGLFRDDSDEAPEYGRVIEIDISEASPSVAGPHRPQDRLPLGAVAPDFRRRLGASMADGGFGATNVLESEGVLPQGAVVIAAITSCTNTSNPQVMIAAGLLARNAAARGLRPPAWVKTSLAPGSPSVTRYLAQAGLLASLETLGFHVIGYGCTTCGGKSGPLSEAVTKEIEQRQVVAAAVLSGNRNFPGRIHKLVRASYIGGPPMVVAYALAGRVDIDISKDPLGMDAQGQPVFLHELQPSAQEVQELVDRIAQRGGFSTFEAEPDDAAPLDWCESTATGTLYPWDPKSQYLREPPFFTDGDANAGDGITQMASALKRTRVLAAFGDSLTTDHISPGGEIPVDTPAGQYLVHSGVAPRDFNSYVGRRGNFEVMVRGTFANVRLRNMLTPDREGGWTLHFPDRTLGTVFDVARAYQHEGTPVIVLAGKEYGTGSSRDWAAKGSALLGVKVVIAESYERIHRANLIGMGVLPLRFRDGEGWQQLGLDGSELFSFEGVETSMVSGAPIRVTAQSADGAQRVFEVLPEVRTTAERQLMAAGGLPMSVLRDLVNKAPACA